jgi:HSP20 family protein
LVCDTFYSYFWDAITLGEGGLSAKWRRNKGSKRFSTFKVFSKVRDRNAPRTFHTKSPLVKRQAHPFGCKVQRVSAERKLREPKPLIDVLEGDDEIVVVAEFAGFNRDDLIICVKDQRLTLSAEALDRKYHKSLNLPKRVIPRTLCTTYKNGVLEIRLKKAVEEKAIDKVAG